MLNRKCRMNCFSAVPTVLMLIILSAGSLFAQWGSDVRLTNNAGESYTAYNNGRCVAGSGDTIHVVWHDGRDGNCEIYYKRSVDGGVNWGADTRLTDDTCYSHDPAVAVAGSEVHVVWDDERDGNSEVFHKWSTDGGATWSDDVLVTVASGSQGTSSVAVVDRYVHVVWTDYTLMGNSEVYHCRSTDGGTTWDTPAQMSYGSGSSEGASVAAFGSSVHVAWHDTRFGWWNNEIYYRCSTDDGLTWGVETRMTEDTTFSNLPSIAVSGTNVHVVWEEMRDGNFEIYYKRSTDNGATWGADTRLTLDPGDSFCPSLIASGANVHLAWQDSRDGNEEIYYKVSTDNGSTWGPDVRLSDYPSISQLPSVAAAGPAVHVVWTDERDGDLEIYYKRDPTGNTGVREYTEGAVEGMMLTAAPNPFTQTTKIGYSILDTRYSIHSLDITVYDAAGCVVRVFHPESSIQDLASEVVWDGRDDEGRQLGGGVYFVRLAAGAHTATEKLLLVR